MPAKIILILVILMMPVAGFCEADAGSDSTDARIGTVWRTHIMIGKVSEGGLTASASIVEVIKNSFALGLSFGVGEYENTRVIPLLAELRLPYKIVGTTGYVYGRFGVGLGHNKYDRSPAIGGAGVGVCIVLCDRGPDLIVEGGFRSIDKRWGNRESLALIQIGLSFRTLK